MKLFLVRFASILLVSGSFFTTACVSTTPATVPDHEPRYDYWQNGGGACCPQHAKMFEEQRAAKKKAS
jgi:hypothetical protein